MKIGMNARFLAHPYTGIGQYTRSLIESLAIIDRKNEYFLFSPEPVELHLPDSFHLIRVPEKDYHSPSLRKANWEHALVPEEMKKWKVDVAHFLYPGNPWARLPMPTVVTIHDVIPWKFSAYRKRWRSKLYYFYARVALKKADHFITVSEFSKQEILHCLRLPVKDITVIPLAPPAIPQNQGQPSIPLRRDFLLYVGGYDERKNVPQLIDTYLKMIANDFPVDLILVGGKGKGLESLITSRYAHYVTPAIPLQPKGNLVFTDPLESHELAALYSQAKMLAHPSVYEGFNLPILEAMHYRLPIVASDIPVNREVTGGAAVFFDPDSQDSIGQAILKLLREPAKASKLAKRGYERSKDYSWEKSAEETLTVYNLFS